MRKTGGAIEEQASEEEDSSIMEMARETPSPDQDLQDYFGAGGSFNANKM